MAQKAKGEGKPSTSPRTQRAAKRRGILDEAEDGIGFKKEKLMKEFMLQKLAMMEPEKAEDVQNFWDQNSEDNSELVEGHLMGSQQNSRDAGVFKFDPNTSSEEELEAESETESEASRSEDEELAIVMRNGRSSRTLGTIIGGKWSMRNSKSTWFIASITKTLSHANRRLQ